MKKQFTQAEIELIQFENDIMTASGTGEGGAGSGTVDGGGTSLDD